MSLKKLLIISLFFSFLAKTQAINLKKLTSDTIDMQQVAKKFPIYYSHFFRKEYFKREKKFKSTYYVTDINPFKADGCSSYPDGTKNSPSLWRDCCIKHDFAYWIGGAKQLKENADRALSICVEEKIKDANISKSLNKKILIELARQMKLGVSIGGSPKLYTPWRWGYGWDYPIGFNSLNSSQKKSILKQLVIYLNKLQDKILEKDNAYPINNHDIFLEIQSLQEELRK